MSGIHRFLTRRERHSRLDKHNKEETSTILSRPLYRGLFASEHPSPEDKDEEKKIKLLERRISQVGISGLKEEHFQYALRSKHAQGDVDRAFEMLLLLEDSIEGIIRGYTPTTKLLGAENRQGVTCYLDALLFAMFARLDCFEAILYKSFSDDPRRKLAIILRLWVNMLRSGKLITTDVTRHLQDALSACGWADAAQLRQQDVSEAFTFITEKLELPLLTLKMDIYHTGKEDVSDDHKFVNERLLEVAIPPDPGDGKPVTLEDCLEAYFNNKIEVKRYLERRSTLTSMKSFDSTSKGFVTHVEEIGSPSTPSPVRSASPRLEEMTPLSSVTELNESPTQSPTSPTLQSRRASIVQERFIPDADNHNNENKGGNTTASHSRLRRGTVRKEVMMPAWQFFSLIPWYTDNTPTSDAKVAAHFSSKRPILGMCLKRYSMLPNGKAVRLNTYVDIPIEIGMPHFIQDDNMDADGPIYGNFKLSLQAVVCHRGVSVDSGHYIALVRGTSANAVPVGVSTASSSEQDNPPSYLDSAKYWMRFDDLAAERITLVDIEQALKDESPYLLFYQILPIDEDAAEANLRRKPPSYSGSEGDQDLDFEKLSPRLHPSSTNGEQSEDTNSASEGQGIEITGPETPVSRPPLPNGRRQSVTFSGTVENVNGTNGLGLQINTTSLSASNSKEEEGGRTSFSFPRRSSRGPKSNSRSRAGSQTGENRISATLSRLTGRLSKERLPSDENGTDGEGEEAGTLKPGSITDGEEMEITVSSTEGKERVLTGRSKERDKDKVKVKQKGKSRERIRKRPERECMVM
ncbi:hypothetical protein VTN00DRAFT_1117 [Thermoascus crustaceus]|uniref:uncharacterized protein n=1 Tax=Thermoascus crustaceus TaxID=5088 RepID=UPI0037448814